MAKAKRPTPIEEKETGRICRCGEVEQTNDPWEGDEYGLHIPEDAGYEDEGDADGG